MDLNEQELEVLLRTLEWDLAARDEARELMIADTTTLNKLEDLSETIGQHDYETNLVKRIREKTIDDICRRSTSFSTPRPVRSLLSRLRENAVRSYGSLTRRFGRARGRLRGLPDQAHHS